MNPIFAPESVDGWPRWDVPPEVLEARTERGVEAYQRKIDLGVHAAVSPTPVSEAESQEPLTPSASFR